MCRSADGRKDTHEDSATIRMCIVRNGDVWRGQYLVASLFFPVRIAVSTPFNSEDLHIIVQDWYDLGAADINQDGYFDQAVP